MRLLLDTCAFIWLSREPDRLSQIASDAIRDDENNIYLCDVSIWEIVLKYHAGKLSLAVPPRQWVAEHTPFFQIERLPIQTEAIFASGELPPVHRDPFDRLIAAHAEINGLTVVSPDPAFATLGVAVLW